MKIELVAYYTDGSSGMVKFEKPAGEHPDSIVTYRAGLKEAEKIGNVVDKMARPVGFRGMVVDTNILCRADIVK